MARVAFRRFGGQVPRKHPRLLDDVNAQKAVNTKLWNGKLRAFKRPRFDFQTVNPGEIVSIYKYRGAGKEGWLHWNTDVDVIKAPLAGDDYGRIYMTGKGRPKFADSMSVIAFTATPAAGAVAGVTQLTVSANRGFAIGDPCVITYAPGVTQAVTLLNVTPSGGNLILTLSAPTTALLTTANTVTNASQRYPLVTYDLGVPAPTTKLSLQVVSGGTDGTDGVLQGNILEVSDIVIFDDSHSDTAKVGEVQSGNSSWSDGPHKVYHDFAGIVTDGQAVRFEASATVNILIKVRFEARDVLFVITRDPGASSIEVADSTTHLVRPIGVGNVEWDFVVPLDGGLDVPHAGTYTYRTAFSPLPGVAGDDNDDFDFNCTWRLRVRYSNRITLKLEAGHGLVVGDSILLAITKTPETEADRELNGKVFKVLALADDVITIDAPFGGAYVPGGTWKKWYQAGETADRAYAYTYGATFNGQDFESPPSPVSSIVTVAINGTVRLTDFIDPTTPVLLWDTAFSWMRIYRLNAGETAQAEYLFRAEVPIGTNHFDDSALGETLGEVMATSGWELPPADLTGLIELPEGGAAGFTKKEFCMAEPYYLHAWPALNRRTTHDEIVAICAFGSSIGIATKGTPYIVTGLDPATVNMERIELVQPCLSKRGAIDIGYAFLYPTPDGLVLISTARAEIVTEGVFTSDEWRALNPSSFIAARYGDRYLCFYDSTAPNPTPPSPGSEFDYDFPAKGGFIFDPRDTVVPLVFLDFWASEVWADPQTGRVYLVQTGAIREFDADRLELEYRWKSKEVTFAVPVSMGFACVEAKSYPVKFTAFADKNPLRTCMVVNKEPFRLPDGEFESWSVEVESVHQVEGIYLAETIEDLSSIAGGQ